MSENLIANILTKLKEGKMNMICECREHVLKSVGDRSLVCSKYTGRVCERIEPFVNRRRDLLERVCELTLRLRSFHERVYDIIDKNIKGDERVKEIRESKRRPTDQDVSYIRERLSDDDRKRVFIIERIVKTLALELWNSQISLGKVEDVLKVIL